MTAAPAPQPRARDLGQLCGHPLASCCFVFSDAEVGLIPEAPTPSEVLQFYEAAHLN